MMNIVAAMPVDENLASFVGKKGSTNSITFYNRKLENDTIVVLFPSQDGDKIYSVAESILLSSQIILSTAIIDKKFGEALIASSLLERKVFLTNENDVEKIVMQSGISDYKIGGKEELLDWIRQNPPEIQSTKPLKIDIDKAFPVRGAGTVVLGIIRQGTLKQHDRVYHSSGKQVMVRSIQSQDQDMPSAEKGMRVGLALKEIEEHEIKKGDLLTQNMTGKAHRVIVTYTISKAAKEAITEGSWYGMAINFSYTECVVKNIADNEMELELKSKIPVDSGDEFFLIRKEMPRIFAAGRVKEATA